MNYTPSYHLDRLGLTNYEQEDFGTLQCAIAQSVEKRFCNSFACTGDPDGTSRIQKRGRKAAKEICPDCGCSLICTYVFH